MSNLIIHIGLHKTGTTYLQYEYFNSLKDVIYMHGNQFFVPWKEQVSKEKKMMLLSYEGFSGIAWNKESSWIESFEVNIAALKQFFPQAIILARLLLPEDFGLIGMIAVFIAIARALVDGGFVSSLIRTKDVDTTDH